MAEHTDRIQLTPLYRDSVLIALAVLAFVLMAGPVALRQGGYPLDDAWIYQTYARNIAESGQWAFIPGIPSTGSTSILWVPLLVPGYLLPVDPYFWTLFVGLLTLVAASLGAARLFDDLSVGGTLLVGLGVGWCWQLVWASASGMETALFAAVAMWFWVWMRTYHPQKTGWSFQNGLAFGVLVGLLMLARPEGVLAGGCAGLALVLPGLSRETLWKRLRWGLSSLVGFSLILVPFLLMNNRISGSLFPNTFYAKQTEYVSLWQLSYLIRFWSQVQVSLIGAQAVVLPGVVLAVIQAIKTRDWRVAAMVGWVLVHWAVYAARLPVTYQHGRYAIPTMPLLMAVGVYGMLLAVNPKADRILVRLGSTAWLGMFTMLLIAVVPVLGRGAYVEDTTFIRDEIVVTAQWIADNTSPGDVLAAHDIGALGYYAPRTLIDLAGLVSPDVIPIMNDGEALADYVVNQGADYLIVFPDWSEAYERLVSDARFCPAWSTEESKNGGYPGNPSGPMTVYRLCEG